MAFNKNGHLTEEQVCKIEREINHKLPQDYNDFLMKTNGGRFDFEDYHEFKVEPIEEEEIRIDKFYGIGADLRDALIYFNNEFGEDCLENTIIIGNTLSNGFIIYIYSGDNKGIYFWDDNYAYECTSDEQNTYYICDTFDELLKLANVSIDD